MNHEFDAIHHLFQERTPFRHNSTVIGNGDDASVHQIPQGFELVISTDSAVQSVHWPDDMPLDIAGERAVNAALSDLGAMGAEPAWIWLAIMANNATSLSQMSDGIVRACLEHKVELAGGDTVSSATNTINITVGGLVPQGKAMRRDQAQLGDEIWLLGDLGLSAAGLQQWQANNKASEFIKSFQSIQPLYTQGIQLREAGVLCCLDISDGLLQDAGHIARASQVGLNIEVTHIKDLHSYQSLSAHYPEEEALKLMLSGGEDYALLCAASPSQHQALQTIGAKQVGTCVEGHEVKLCFQEKSIDYNIKGFDHFA